MPFHCDNYSLDLENKEVLMRKEEERECENTHTIDWDVNTIVAQRKYK